MRTIHEVSELAGVSIRALRHYDQIGLLRPSMRSEAGYRLYSEDDLARLQEILLFRALEFPLKDIRQIMESPGYSRPRALEQQIELLRLRRKHLDDLIELAQSLQEKGAGAMSFEPFDTSKMDEYAAQAKASWGGTPAWREFEKRDAGRTQEDNRALGGEMMALFVPFAQMAAEGGDPASPEAVAQARRIQEFISEHYYRCTDEIFAQLGVAYGSGGEFTQNIDAAAGPGAAAFAARAVESYLSQK